MSKCITYVTGFKMNFFFWVTFDFEKVFMVMCSVWRFYTIRKTVLLYRWLMETSHSWVRLAFCLYSCYSKYFKLCCVKSGELSMFTFVGLSCIQVTHKVQYLIACTCIPEGLHNILNKQLNHMWWSLSKIKYSCRFCTPSSWFQSFSTWLSDLLRCFSCLLMWCTTSYW